MNENINDINRIENINDIYRIENIIKANYKKELRKISILIRISFFTIKTK